MVGMLGRAGGFEYGGVKVEAGAVHDTTVARRGCGLGLRAVGHLGVCLYMSEAVTAAATSRSEVCERGVAINKEVYVGVAFVATVLHTSLMRSTT